MAATKAAPKKRSQFEEVWRRLKKNKMAMIGLAIVLQWMAFRSAISPAWTG